MLNLNRYPTGLSPDKSSLVESGRVNTTEYEIRIRKRCDGDGDARVKRTSAHWCLSFVRRAAARPAEKTTRCMAIIKSSDFSRIPAVLSDYRPQAHFGSFLPWLHLRCARFRFNYTLVRCFRRRGQNRATPAQLSTQSSV